MTKGEWPEQWLDKLRSFGVEVKPEVKYLGILLGHVNSNEAYAPTIYR